MKKLTNVSPFLLLLFPVFMVMLFSFTVENNQNIEKDVATKVSATKTAVLVKAAVDILK